MLNIAQGLAKHDDIQVDLLLVKAMSQVSKDIRVVDLNCSRIIKSIPAVINYLKTEKPQSVLSALDTTNLIMIWAKILSRSPARIVVSVHCNFSSALKGAKHVRAKFLPYLVGFFYRKADAIVAVSHGVAADLEVSTGIDKKTVDVVVNPVITMEIENKKNKVPDHRWFGKNAPDVILGIGRLTYQKNFELLIRAFSRVQAKNGAKLLILGSGDQEEELKLFTKKLALQDHVEFAGFVENPYSYLSNARLFVLSSRYEGLPTVLIEALHCGIEVISTDCPSGPDEILKNGQLGTLVPVDDVKALEEAINRVLSRSKIVVNSNDLDQYRHEIVVSNYYDILLKQS